MHGCTHRSPTVPADDPAAVPPTARMLPTARPVCPGRSAGEGPQSRWRCGQCLRRRAGSATGPGRVSSTLAIFMNPVLSVLRSSTPLATASMSLRYRNTILDRPARIAHSCRSVITWNSITAWWLAPRHHVQLEIHNRQARLGLPHAHARRLISDLVADAFLVHKSVSQRVHPSQNNASTTNAPLWGLWQNDICEVVRIDIRMSSGGERSSNADTCHGSKA